MAQTTVSSNKTPKTKTQNDNEWLESFLNSSEEDLITMASKQAKGKGSEFSVVQVDNIIEQKKKASFLFNNKKYREALLLIEDSLKLLPGDMDLNFFQAQCLFHLGQLDRVEIIVGNLLNSDDLHRMVQLPRLYTFCLLKKNNFKGAQRFLEDTMPAYKNDIQLRNMYGYALEQQDKLEEAEKVFSDILSEDPDNTNANNSLAYVFYRSGKFLEIALTLAEKALLFEPENPAFLDTAAMIKFALGDINGARLTLQKALGIAPSNPVILDHLGKILEA